MYINIKNIDNVKSPINDINGILYYLKEGNLVSFNKNPEVLLPIENAESLIEFKGKFLILDDLDEIFDVYDTATKKSIFFSLGNIAIEGVDNSSLLFYTNDEPRSYGYADLTGIQFITNISHGILKRFDNNIFDLDDSFIRLYDSSNSFKWQFNFADIGSKNNVLFEYLKFIGVAYDKVFILTKNCHLVVLNNTDGTLFEILYSKETFLCEDAFMHPEGKYIYNLGSYFVKINTETLKVETQKKFLEEKTADNPSPILYGIKNSSLQEEYISFTSFTKERFGFAKWVGLYDYSKEEVVWHHELLPVEGQLSIPAFEYPKLACDKLYVLDTEDTLHIFEKEPLI